LLKTSYSGDRPDACLEASVRSHGEGGHIQDSKDVFRRRLTFSTTAWRTFLVEKATISE
jgi:hypothetical protein